MAKVPSVTVADDVFLKGLAEAAKNDWTLDELIAKRFGKEVNGEILYPDKNTLSTKKSNVFKTMREALMEKRGMTEDEAREFVERRYNPKSAKKGRAGGSVGNAVKNALERMFAELDEEDSAE